MGSVGNSWPRNIYRPNPRKEERSVLKPRGKVTHSIVVSLSSPFHSHLTTTTTFQFPSQVTTTTPRASRSFYFVLLLLFPPHSIPYEMTMLTATSIAMNLRSLSQSSPIPFHNSRQISSLAASTTTTSTAQLRFNLTCHATKEDSSLESKTANTETILHSFSPLPLLYTAALIPGGTLQFHPN
jgi:hypothetical protein